MEHSYCKIIFGFLLVLLLAACQGVYTNAPIPQSTKVHYRYISPEDPAQQGCVEQCETNRNTCLETMNKNLCREEYHSCFRLCGGQVERR